MTTFLSILLPPLAEAAPLAIVNGGFETGTDGQSSLSPIAGWTDAGATAGFWLQDGTGGGSFPQDPSQPQAGSLYLSANRLAGGAGSQPTGSTLGQIVAVDPGDIGLVQSGAAVMHLSFYYQDTDVNDSATVTVEYLDASSQVVASASTGALPNIAANATPYDPVNAPWTLVKLSDPVPFDAESVRILIVTNRVGGSATNLHFDSFSGSISPEDADEDGLPDGFEQTIIDADPADGVTDLSHVAGPNDFPATTDFDEDGLSDADEYDEFTDPLDPDSDDDGLLDGPEINGTDNEGQSHGFGPTDPLFDDSDLDTLLDGAELNGTDNEGASHGFGPTDPNTAFSDEDAFEDAWEIQYGLNPNSAAGDDGDEGDPDMDGLDNLGEFDNLTNPSDPDTDDDHLLDGPEVAGTDNNDVSHGFGPTQPGDADTDDDGFGDWLEVSFGSDPNNVASVPGTVVPFVNGGFESPVVTPSGAGVAVSGGTVPGWLAVTNDMYVTDVFTGTAVAAGNPTAAHEGFQFATAERRAPDPDVDATALVGGIDATMAMRQDLDVTSLAAGIDAGARTIAVSFGFYDDDVYDNGIVSLEFLDASAAPLGRRVSFRTDDVPESPAWKTRAVFGYPPAGTRTVRVTVEVIKAVVNTTSARNLHFDDFRASLFHLDEDNDGMADDWEIANGLDPDDMTDAAGQDDSDTLSNLAEFEAGTDPFAADTDGDGVNDDIEIAEGSDPLDPASIPETDTVLVVTAASFNPEGDFVVTVSGMNPARSYRLMRSTDLAGFPSEVVSKQPAGETDSFTDADPPAGRAFYIVEEINP